MPEKAKRTPKNVADPFFVEADLCIACCLPEVEAPDLMGYDEENESCYFKRQPVTRDETKRAFHAISVSCCGAVQYDGASPKSTQACAKNGSGSMAALE